MSPDVRSEIRGHFSILTNPLRRRNSKSENGGSAILAFGVLMNDVPSNPSRSASLAREPEGIRYRVIEEACELELDFYYSAKSHYNAARRWESFGFWLGMLAVIISSINGIVSLSNKATPEVLHSTVIGGVVSIFVSCLAAIITFSKATDKSQLHKVAGNRFNNLRDRVRQFYTVECFMHGKDDEVWKKLEKFTMEKDKANSESPSIPEWAYKISLQQRARKTFQDEQLEFVKKSRVLQLA